MCRHFEPEKRPYCDHDRAEPPVEKESANFCDYFKPVNRFFAEDASRSDKARSELGELFGDEAGSDQLDDLGEADAGDPLNKLNDLFDD